MKKFRVEGWFGIIGLIVGAVYGYQTGDYIIPNAIAGMIIAAAGYAILNWIYSIIKKS